MFQSICLSLLPQPCTLPLTLHSVTQNLQTCKFIDQDVIAWYKFNVFIIKEVTGMINRVEVSPNICHGQPCIKGTRIMVYTIIELIEAGLAPDDIIRDYYPNITREDIKGCLHYAATLIKNQEYIPFEKVL